MIAVPAPTPVTIPVLLFTVATEVLLLLQDPPASPLLVKLIEAPMHTIAAPETVPAFTDGLTVMFILLEAGLHPPTAYLITVDPAATAVTNPVLLFTVATAVLSLLQVPPALPLLLNV